MISENLFCKARYNEKQIALHRANMSPVFIFRPLPEQVIRNTPNIAVSADNNTLEDGTFLSRIPMITGVITIES